MRSKMIDQVSKNTNNLSKKVQVSCIWPTCENSTTINACLSLSANLSPSDNVKKSFVFLNRALMYAKRLQVEVTETKHYICHH